MPSHACMYDIPFVSKIMQKHVKSLYGRMRSPHFPLSRTPEAQIVSGKKTPADRSDWGDEDACRRVVIKAGVQGFEPQLTDTPTAIVRVLYNTASCRSCQASGIAPMALYR